MIKEEKNNLLLRLQCLHGQYGNTLANAMSIGKCTDKHLCINSKAYYSIQVIRRYQVFSENVTNAGKITISRNGGTLTDVTVDIYVDNILLGSYTGIGTQEVILDSLQNVINSGTNFHGYIAFAEGNTLYLYTYNNTESYNSVLLGSYTENEVVDTPSLVLTSTSLENKLCEILNLWNCITDCELCEIINFLKDILSNGCK